MTNMTPQEARQVSALGLAYIGDCVYELLTRRHILARGNFPVKKLHLASVGIVCAAAQSKAFGCIEGLLSEEETAVYKRGRNANGSTVPKNADPVDYRRATGLEALFGYLWLIGESARIEELYDIIYQQTQKNVCDRKEDAHEKDKSSVGHFKVDG